MKVVPRKASVPTLGATLPRINKVLPPLAYALKKQRTPMLVRFIPAIVNLPVNADWVENECEPTDLNVFGSVRMPDNPLTCPATLKAGWFLLNAPYTRLGCPTMVST